MKTKPDTISFKVRTSVSACEYKGGLDDGIKCAFFYVPTPERRLAVIESLKSAHEKLCAAEVTK